MNELLFLESLIEEYNQYEADWSKATEDKDREALKKAIIALNDAYARIIEVRTKVDEKLKDCIEFIDKHRSFFCEFNPLFFTDEESNYVKERQMYYVRQGSKPIIHNPVKIYTCSTMYHYISKAEDGE